MRRAGTRSGGLVAIALVLVLSATGAAADADGAGADGSTTSLDGAPGITSEVSVGVPTAAASPPMARSVVLEGAEPGLGVAGSSGNEIETITFSEFPYGQSITTQYQDRGIIFGGDSPFITSDGANPTSPVLSGTPRFQGSILGTFVKADGTPRTVNHLELDVGYIDTARSVHVVVYSLGGVPLLEVSLAANGIVHTTIDQVGMGSFLVEQISNEPAGFAIDNVSYASPDASDYPVGEYAALGDSFQSGQGVGNYEQGTDEGSSGNGCRRSFDAYAHRLVDDGVVNLTLDFRACSGAVMADFYDAQHPATDNAPEQGPQLHALSVDTRLVTIGIVGNDLDFAGTLKNCIFTAGGNVISPLITWWRSCARNQGAGVDANIASLQDGQLHDDLLDLYRRVRANAQNARVIVVAYPQFFQEDGFGWYQGCQGIRSSDQVWINEKIRQANEAIGATAAEAGFEYVSMTDVLAGHAECSDEPGINGIRANDFSASFHPNALGHELIADRLEGYLGQPFGPAFIINPEETVTTHYEIVGSVLTLNVGWPGSDVVTTLTSPSGACYTRDEPNGAEHGVGPTWEYYTITDPEPGQWTVESYGADVAPEGEPVTYVLSDKVAPNQPPTAVVTTSHDGDTFTFDATASTDTDGTIVDYQWEFADGTYATGPVVTHTFAPGTYDVTLVTIDNQGAKGFGYTDQVIHIGSVITGSTVYSGSSLQVTNDVDLAGPDANLIVAGDLECNSRGHIGGDVTVEGDVHLTNSCRIDGSLIAGGAVSMDSTSSIGGDLTAVGAVRFQSTGHIGGQVTTGGTFTVIDGAAVADLIDSGVLGGPVTTGAVVPAPDLGPTPVVGAKTLQVDQESTWAQWLHDTAVAAGAPAWSAGLSTRPGCTLASWTVGTSTIAVDANTRIDATRQTTGCSSVSLFGLSLQLSGDLTIVASGLQSTNGMQVTSADGLPHTLRILVPGQINGAQRANAVSLLGGTTADPMITVEIGTPGTVSLSGGVDLVGQIAAGRINADGHITLTSTGS